MTQKRLKTLYQYLSSGHFQNKKTGRKVLGQVRKSGYVQISARVNSKIKHFQYHRMIWLWHKGRLPKELDHINRIKTDNRIENLRAVTRSQNMTGVRRSFFLFCFFLLNACSPTPPDVPACEHLSQRLSTDAFTGHLMLTPSPTCLKKTGEVECGHCVYIVSGREIFLGENEKNRLNGKRWSELRASAVYLPAKESYAPLASYIIDACKKMNCSNDVTRFKVKLDSLNGVAGAIQNH